ncbi:hypothetical protein [Nocardia aurea]|uniref:hypothetical protein n=1 Tax=Nocardia aurea TaxID=2144174 RepID=UPI0033A29D3D
MTTRNDETGRAPTVAAVVGRNAKRLRGKFTIEQVALEARHMGLKWNSGRVADLEAGRISPTVPTLVALTMAFTSLYGGTPVALRELLQHDGLVELNENISIPGERLLEFFASKPVVVRASDIPQAAHQTAEGVAAFRAFVDEDDWLEQLPKFNAAQLAWRNSTGTEERAAKDLGISVAELAVQAVKLWGRGFSEERDNRAGPEANNQKRGRVARALKDELRQVISHGND